MNVGKDVLIIGGGMAGMGCASRLLQLKAQRRWDGSFKIIEKTDGLGGRCSVVITEAFYFDKGAQQFGEPQTRSWEAVHTSLRRMKMVSRWGRVVKSYDCTTNEVTDLPDDVPQYTFSPSTRVIEKFILGSLLPSEENIFVSTEITQIQRWERDQWIFKQKNDRWKRSDILVLACPPRTILPMFVGSDDFPLPEAPQIEAAGRVQHRPLLVFMVGWAEDGIGDFDIMRLAGHPVFSSLYNNATKDGRPRKGMLTAVCTPEYSLQVMQNMPSREEILIQLGMAMRSLPFAKYYPPPSFGDIHLWQQGFHNSSTPLESLYCEEARLGVCGDWTLGANTVQAAWTSGVRVANEIAGFARESEEHHPTDYMDLVTQTNMKQSMLTSLDERVVKDYVSWERE